MEGEAQGDEEAVQKLLKDVDQGPSMAHVVRVDKTELDPQREETSFEVR